MPLRPDEPRPVGAASIGAIEDGQVLVAQVRRALDRLRPADQSVETLDLHSREPAHANMIERLKGGVAVPGREGEKSVGMQRAAHERDVLHGNRKRPIHLGSLGHISNAGRRPFERPPIEQDAAMGWLQDAVQAFQERALPGAVWPHQRRNFSFAKGERNVLDRRPLGKMNAEVLRGHARRMTWPGIEREHFDTRDTFFD